MKLGHRIGIAIIVAAVFSVLCMSLGLRGVIHAELGAWASRFDAVPSMGYWPNLGRLYGLVDLTLSLACGFTVFFALLLALWVGSNIGRRLTAVDRGLATIATGQLGKRIEERGTDELGHIAHSANLLARNIEHAKDDERQLVAGLAHDLAHPLTAMRGSLEAARDCLRHDIEPAAAERLLENVAHLEATLSDLRDVSAYEAGLIRLDWTTADVAEIARSMVRIYSDAAQRRGIRLDESLETGLVVCTDTDRLQRILANLLVNAFAATQPGGVVTFRVYRERRNIVLEVEDSAGEAAGHRLAAAVRGEEDSGLGLRVVRTLASALQIQVTARSGVHGSKVQLRIALAKTSSRSHKLQETTRVT